MTENLPLKNAKHEAVLQHFIAAQDRVGWKSYVAIYPNSSQRAAETGWSRLLKNAEFAARKDALERAVVERVVERTAITKERVLAELALIGFANMQDYAAIFPDGEVAMLSREHAAAIQELVVDTYMDGAGDEARAVKRVRFKLGDKRAALVDIGRHLKMFTDKHEVTGKDGGPVETKDVSAPIDELEAVRRIAFALERAGRKLQQKPDAPAKRTGAKAGARS
jgi:phage terminase small subunit